MVWLEPEFNDTEYWTPCLGRVGRIVKRTLSTNARFFNAPVYDLVGIEVDDPEDDTSFFAWELAPATKEEFLVQQVTDIFS